MPRLAVLATIALFAAVDCELYAFDEAYGPTGAESAGPAALDVMLTSDQNIAVTYKIAKPVVEQRVEATNVGNRMRNRAIQTVRWVEESRIRSIDRDRVQVFRADRQPVDPAALDKRLTAGDVALVYPEGQEPDPGYLTLLKPDTLVLTMVDPQPAPSAPSDIKTSVAASRARSKDRTMVHVRPMGAPPQQAPHVAKPDAAASHPQVGHARVDGQGLLHFRRSTSTTITESLLFLKETAGYGLPGSIKHTVKTETLQEIPVDVVRAYNARGKAVDKQALVAALKEEKPVLISASEKPDAAYSWILKPGTLVLVFPQPRGSRPNLGPVAAPGMAPQRIRVGVGAAGIEFTPAAPAPATPAPTADPSS